MLNTSKKNLSKALKNWAPPVIFKFLRNLLGKKTEGLKFYGPYPSWLDAKKSSTGYNAENILDKVLDATLKVKSGEAVYERDSVLFDEVQYSWPITAGLMYAAVRGKGHLSVLDFGGALGSSYFQNREFLVGLKSVFWSVVEQHHFFDVGRQFIQDERLVFYSTIKECVKKEKPNVVLLSSVLQYLNNPYKILDELINISAELILIDRTSFYDELEDIVGVQKVPGNIYNASYPFWVFSKSRVINYISHKYRLIDEPISHNGIFKMNKIGFTFNGLIFLKK